VWTEDPEFGDKIDGVKKSFLAEKPEEFYYNAFLFIVPKRQLLYKISYDSQPVHLEREQEMCPG